MHIKINSALALLLLVIVIPGIWILQGLGKINLPGEVSGALIATFTLIVQFYFRKAPPATTPAAPPTPDPAAPVMPVSTPTGGKI